MNKKIIVAFGAVPAITIAGVGTFAGVNLQYSVSDCISNIEQREQAAIEQKAGNDATVAQKKAEPAERYGDHRNRSIPGDLRAAACKWPNADEDTVVARASLEYSFFGFLGTLFFGVIGVLGIYLTYALAREEIHRRR